MKWSPSKGSKAPQTPKHKQEMPASIIKRSVAMEQMVTESSKPDSEPDWEVLSTSGTELGAVVFLHSRQELEMLTKKRCAAALISKGKLKPPTWKRKPPRRGPAVTPTLP